MKKVEWKVQGMTCANCALTISKYLEKQGLRNISVNLLSGDVSFEDTGTDNTLILQKGIDSLGYRVSSGKATARKNGFLNTPLQKFWFCLPFTIVLWLPMLPLHLEWLMNATLQLCITLPVMIVGMSYFGKSGIKSIANGIPNMNVLVALGALSAFVYSLAGTIMMTGMHSVYYESAATIITIVFLGYWMEDVSISATQGILKRLTADQKTMANMIAFDDLHQEQIFQVESDQLRIGDLVLIKSGEYIPADCKVLWGTGSVNESVLTGESNPIEKQKKDYLVGGSLLESGIFRAQVTAAGKDSILSGIIALAKQAQSEKPPVQRLADRISAIFVPAVLILSLLTFIINRFTINVPADIALMRSIAVLVIACPCAMGLATPAAIAVGMGRAAQNGILFRNAKSLELFRDIKQVVFDKTGTLTTGQFTISDFKVLSGGEEEFKRICYSLEKYSNHPIAKTIAAEWKHDTPVKWIHIEEVKASGMRGTDENNGEYFLGASIIGNSSASEDIHNVYVYRNNITLGWIDVKDKTRPFASAVVNSFKNHGVRTILLSGDSKRRCQELADELNIDEVHYQQTPEQKLNQIKRLTILSPTAMIGDGINDAAALAASTIGIAVSDASAIARQNAQVILVNSGIKNLPLAMQLGYDTYATIKQNLFWAFFYNIIAIPVAAAGLLTPEIAAFAMGFSDVILVANSFRLKWKKYPVIHEIRD